MSHFSPGRKNRARLIIADLLQTGICRFSCESTISLPRYSLLALYLPVCLPTKASRQAGFR